MDCGQRQQAGSLDYLDIACSEATVVDEGVAVLALIATPHMSLTQGTCNLNHRKNIQSRTNVRSAMLVEFRYLHQPCVINPD